ncbi:MAG: hypothetical protein AAB433_18420 [Nitrospirota bacterium]
MAKKVTDGKLEVDFTYSGRRYRGLIPVATLASLLTGTLPGEEDANLGKAGPAWALTRFDPPLLTKIDPPLTPLTEIDPGLLTEMAPPARRTILCC